MYDDTKFDTYGNGVTVFGGCMDKTRMLGKTVYGPFEKERREGDGEGGRFIGNTKIACSDEVLVTSLGTCNGVSKNGAFGTTNTW